MNGTSGMSVLITGLDWPAETFLQRLIRGLLDVGVSVTVATDRRPQASWLERDGFDWIHVPNWEGNVPARLARLARGVGRGLLRGRETTRTRMREATGLPVVDRMRIMNRLLPFAGRRWDVLYLPWNAPAIHYLRLFDQADAVVLSCRGSQVLVAPHNPARADILRGLEETFLRADRVHCVSHVVMEEAVRLGLDRSKAEVIWPAVDPDLFSPGGTSRPDGAGSLNIISTGSLIWVKGAEYLLLALRRVVDLGVEANLTLVGDGQERDRILFGAHDLGLTDRVRLAGWVSPDELVGLLRRADAFAFPTLSDGFGNALIEAMSCALPVVTTNAGGMVEAVCDGREGFVVPARDPAAMADALVRLARDPDLRARMGAAGRARVLEDFRLEDQVKKFVELFQKASGRQASVGLESR